MGFDRERVASNNNPALFILYIMYSTRSVACTGVNSHSLLCLLWAHFVDGPLPVWSSPWFLPLSVSRLALFPLGALITARKKTHGVGVTTRGGKRAHLLDEKDPVGLWEVSL